MVTAEDRLLTVPEVAARCRVSVDTVRRWLREKRLKGTMLGGQKTGYRVLASDLERFVRGEPADAADGS
jgi:excisionase family DNA binding protein